MKKKDIVAKALDTVNKLVQADGIPYDICDDFRVCIAMIQDINRIEFVTIKREFSMDRKVDKVPESATLSGVHPKENIYRKPDA
tara:strand:+ start:250 stop:501 length:252 start_codon:yes stop_codon:yes gene_type:complete